MLMIIGVVMVGVRDPVGMPVKVGIAPRVNQGVRAQRGEHPDEQKHRHYLTNGLHPTLCSRSSKYAQGTSPADETTRIPVAKQLDACAPTPLLYA